MVVLLLFCSGSSVVVNGVTGTKVFLQKKMTAEHLAFVRVKIKWPHHGVAVR